MTSNKDNTEQPAPKTDLAALYRPLGLKAVTAAYLMLKSKPPLTKKIA
ncbi:hypothetical protein AB4Z52_08760 [Rhizobium sp. 2YAF20]|jgi:hypothetical protein